MRRGTTPTITLTLDCDLTGHTVYVTLQDGGEQLTLGNDRLTLDVADGVTTISFTLSQEETLAMPESTAEVQVRAIKDGVAVASTIGRVAVSRILLEGVIDE